MVVTVFTMGLPTLENSRVQFIASSRSPQWQKAKAINRAFAAGDDMEIRPTCLCAPIPECVKRFAVKWIAAGSPVLISGAYVSFAGSVNSLPAAFLSQGCF